MCTVLDYHIDTTAPGHPVERFVVPGRTFLQAETLAKELASDFFGVRAEHVVTHIVDIKPQF